MTYELTDLDLVEISAVDQPANQHASVVLFKSVVPQSDSGYTDGVKPNSSGTNNEGDRSVTVEELTQKLDGLQAQVTDLTKRAEEAEAAKTAAGAAIAALTKSAEDAGMDVTDGKVVKRADPEFVEIDGEKVEKALVPAPVLRAIEKQAAVIATMQAKAEEVDLAKRGTAELPNLAGTALAKGRLLAAVEGDADLLKALKAADAAMAEVYTFKGTDSVDETAPGHTLDQLAKAHAAAQNVDFHAAYAHVIKNTAEGRDAYKQYLTEAN